MFFHAFNCLLTRTFLTDFYFETVTEVDIVFEASAKADPLSHLFETFLFSILNVCSFACGKLQQFLGYKSF